MSAKSDKISLEFREAGNKCVENKDYIKALMKYNASLCYAKSKEYAAMAYANRSAVFLKIGMYCECLENVRWAQEHNYPKNKASKLQEREEYCYQKISGSETSNVYEDLDKATNFFKLSHPPNPRIPFIADCLEYRLSDNGKMAVFTKIDLKAGDIIAMEKPVYSMVFNNAKYKRCIMCYTTKKFNLIPHKESVAIMFCSESCKSSFKDIIDDSFNDLNDLLETSLDIIKFEWAKNLVAHELVGNLSEHQEIWKGKLKKSIFDYDMNQPIFKKISYVSNCIASLSSKPFQVDVSRNPDSYIEAFMHIFHTKLSFMMCTEINENSHMKSKNHLSSLSLLFPLFNHNCSNNIDMILIDNMNVLIANRPIRANLELTTTIPRSPKCELFSLNVRCGCEFNNYDDFRHFLPVSLSDLDQCIERLKNNWECTNKHYEKYPNCEFNFFTKENFILLSSIGHRITHPCFLSWKTTRPTNNVVHTLEMEH